MPRMLLPLIACFCLLFGLQGCRCSTGLHERDPGSGGAEMQQGGEQGPAMWCRACAKKGFTACKRVDGAQDEDTLRRKAEVAACAEVGISEKECTAEVLSMVECGP